MGLDTRRRHCSEGKCVAKYKEKDLATNQDAETVSHRRHWRDVLGRRKNVNSVEKGLHGETGSRWKIGYSQQTSTSTRKWRD